MQTIKKVTETTEEYLEAIYKLQGKGENARTMDLVRLLKVVPGSVTNTIERLEKEGFVTHEPYKGVKLTEKGKSVALQVIRRHRLCERLLTDVLCVEWENVHDAACKLEHAFTQDIINKLEKALGHPRTCPHGNPIPTECGGIFEEKTERLTNLEKGDSAMVVKITEEKTEILKCFAALGIRPGTDVKVLNKNIKKALLVKIGKTEYELNGSMAAMIEVRKARKE